MLPCPKITTESLTSARGIQVAGAGAFTLIFLFIALRGILDWGGWIAGACLVLGLLLPFAMKVIVQTQLRGEFFPFLHRSSPSGWVARQG